MNKRAYLICNAHIDPVWLWQRPEGAATAVSTFRIAADFCEEFDGFVFNHNEALLYEWVEEFEPALFTRIQRLVKEGKWHIMGGWYLQPDCNMPSGESFIRQIMAGRTYFEEKFGQRPTTAISFDAFGHSRGLVQILSKSGYDSYLVTRPSHHHVTLPAEDFVWVGYDGSEVMVRRCDEGYNSHPGQAADKVIDCLEKFHPGENPIAVLWGVGDHGGGPSREDIAKLDQFFTHHPDIEIIHSTPEQYFCEKKGVRADMPRVDFPLTPWAVGCYTSIIRIKQQHRALENDLYKAEKMLSSAAVQGLADYDKALLLDAQRDLMFCEFHDILPGSCIRPVEEDSLVTLHHGREIAARLAMRAFFALTAGQEKAAEDELPLLVYNPHPYPVTTVVSCEFQPARQNWDGSFSYPDIYDEAGNKIPSQAEATACTMNLDWRKNPCFLATLAPSSMNRFNCRLRRMETRPVPTLKPENGQYVFDNGKMRLAISTATGLIDSYQVNGREMLASDACKPLVIKDNADPWGMTVNSFREVEGEFSLLSEEEAAYQSGFLKDGTMPAVRVIEEGEVRTIIEAVMGYRHSTLTMRYILPRHTAGFSVEIRTVWNEPLHMLKLSFPTAFGGAEAYGQSPFGRDHLKGDGSEQVAQKWFAAANATDALTIANNGTHAFDFAEGELRCTLLRSPGYSMHPIGNREWRPDDRCYEHIDLGERCFTFEVTGGAREERFDHIEREAQLLNERPYAVNLFPCGDTTVKKPLPLIELSGDDTVVMSAFKQVSATASGDYAFRLFEPTGRARQVTVSLPSLDIRETVEMKPFEIRTFRVDMAKREMRPCSIDEKL